jgi:hypothetical protein
VTASVVERATNGGGPGLGAGVLVEHDTTLTTANAEIRMRANLGIGKR